MDSLFYALIDSFLFEYICLRLCSRYPNNTVDSIVSTNGFNLKVSHKVSGLGNILEGATITLSIEAYGTIDGKCYNNKGSNEPPGQNPVAYAEGQQTGDIASDDNGNFVFTVEAAKDCTCGVTCSAALDNGDNIIFDDDSETSLIHGKKVRAVHQYETVDAGAPVCTSADEDDEDNGVTCPGGCNCRVEEGAESCPNTQRWNQYSTGVIYESFTIDAIYNPQGSIIKEVQRLVCPIVHTGDGEYEVGSDGCISCELCREGLNGSNAEDECDYDAILASHPMNEGCPSSIFSTRALRG